MGIDALIFLPNTVSEAKLKKIQSFGAKTQLVGNDSGDAEVAARNYAEKNQLPYLSPYNDEDVLSKISWKQKDVTITETLMGGEE